MWLCLVLYAFTPARQFLRQRFLSTTFPAHKENRPCSKATGAVRDKCLTMTYSHMEKLHTTIGAKRFHFRVRHGIGWFTLAMVVRRNGGILRCLSLEAYGLATRNMNHADRYVSILSQSRRLPTQTPWVLYGQASRAISTG